MSYTSFKNSITAPNKVIERCCTAPKTPPTELLKLIQGFDLWKKFGGNLGAVHHRGPQQLCWS